MSNPIGLFIFGGIMKPLSKSLSRTFIIDERKSIKYTLVISAATITIAEEFQDGNRKWKTQECIQMNLQLFKDMISGFGGIENLEL